MVRVTIEKVLDVVLDAASTSLCGAIKYERIKGSKATAEKVNANTAYVHPMKSTKAAQLLEGSRCKTLTCYAYPDSHWIKSRINNPLARVMTKIRRFIRVVCAFPIATPA